jgi:hypothetical protein
MMELIEDYCHWCEVRITRASVNLLWIDDYESADCEFHPAVFNSDTLKRNLDESAPHQPIREVHEVIKQHHYIKKAQRDKNQRVRLVDDNAVMISGNSQRTSSKAAEKVLSKTGTIRRMVYDQIKSNNDYGMTDHELEMVLRGKHQTISASRRSLVVDGWIIDSGQTRKNPQGNDCIVWIEKDEVFNEMLFNVK